MKKKITAACAVLIVTALALAVLTGAVGSGNSSPPAVRVIALERQSLEQSIALTGTVYSAQLTEVHSTLHFPVQSVNVRVGDRVNEGDLLAVLDMTPLEMNVRQMQASLDAARAAAGQNLAMTQNALETLRRNIASGDDPMLMQARMAVLSAQLAVEAAEVEVSATGRGASNARRDLREYRRYLRYHGSDRYDGFDPVLSQLRAAATAGEAAFERARSGLEIASESLAHAQEAYQSMQVLSADALAVHEDMVRAAQVATNFSDVQIAIQSLQNELEKAQILSPVSGTVTEILAEEGALGSGLLFVIQDADNLIVKTNISEFDLASINLGDRVSIRTDATGDTVFTGTLERIAPTSTPGGGYATFESEVAVFGAAGLRIGMSARLSIVTEQRSDVLVLPTHAVVASVGDESVIFIAVPVEDGGYIAEAVAVYTGMQTQRLVEVWAEGLEDGALVIVSTEGIQAGMRVTPQA